MTVSWNDEYDCNELTARMEQSRTLSADGGVAFKGFEISQLEAVLYSMLRFSVLIPEVEKRGIIWEAVKTAAKYGTITAKSLMTEINKITNAYLEKPLLRYVLVTTISIRPETVLSRINFRNAIITFQANLDGVFLESRSKVEAISKPSLFAEIPKNYIFTKVSVLARTAYEAADQALDSLDVIRGIWNWLENRRYSFRLSFGRRKPINKFILGPLHTLHFPNGKLAIETWWYETKRFGNLEPSDITQDVSKMEIFLSKVRNNLAKCKYKHKIEDAIAVYSRALDEWDGDGAFLKLWSVLEQLTNTDESYKVTIRRASFIFEERNFYQQILRHLKDFRNKFVHEAADSSEIETYIYQLKNIVEALLSFHLGNKYRFGSIEEASEFLDMPSDKKELTSRIEMMKYAQKYLKHI